jgi:hypothetical protein
MVMLLWGVIMLLNSGYSVAEFEQISIQFCCKWSNDVPLFLFMLWAVFISYLGELMKISWKKLLKNVISCFQKFSQTVSQSRFVLLCTKLYAYLIDWHFWSINFRKVLFFFFYNRKVLLLFQTWINESKFHRESHKIHTKMKRKTHLITTFSAVFPLILGFWITSISIW